MGAKSTLPTSSPEPTQTLDTNHHPKLAKANLINKNNSGYFEVAQSILHRELFHKWENNLHQYRKYEHIDSLYLPTHTQFKAEGLCGNTGIIRSEYDALPFILSSQIRSRKAINQVFLQKELWYLLYTLINAGHYLHSDAKLIGDIRPQNIFISQEGAIKCVTMYSFYNDDNNFNKTFSTREITYLSPEQIQDIQRGKDQPTTPSSHSQCFSIGLTVLSALLLSDLSCLYDSDFTFHSGQFTNCIKKLKSLDRYSDLLRKMIQGLCRKNPQQRLTCADVVEILKPVQAQILTLQPFELKYIPNSLKSKLQSKLSRVIQPTLNRSKYNSPIKKNSIVIVHQYPSQYNEGMESRISSTPQINSTFIPSDHLPIKTQKSPRVSSYGSNMQSYIPYQPEINQNANKQKGYDQLVKSYDELLKDVDEKLRESRQLFPDPQ